MAGKNVPHDAMIDEAIAWHIRLREADDTAWMEFSDWLEQDPAHNQAYEMVVDRDLAIDARSPEADLEPEVVAASKTAHAANDQDEVVEVDELDRSSVWRWAALAATLAFALFFSVQFLGNRSELYTVATASGEVQNITLADGSQIDINGASEITLDRQNERYAELVSGEALFTVVHNADEPFVVDVGETRLVDLGTIFNVVRSDQQLRVGVAEGVVRYEGAKQVELKAGDTLRRDDEGLIVLRSRPIEAIGGWVDQTLVYEDEPLAGIAQDLSRAAGVEITVSPDLSGRTFSGVIQTGGDSVALRGRIENVLGLRVEGSETAWSLQP